MLIVNHPPAEQPTFESWPRLRWLAGLPLLTAGEVEEVAQLARGLGVVVVLERCDLADGGRRSRWEVGR